MALLLLGCSAGEEDRTPATAPIFFMTGRSGTQTVAVRAAEPDGSSRVLRGVELETAPSVPISEFDYATMWHFSEASLTPSPDGLAVLFRHGPKVDILDVANGLAVSPIEKVDGWIEWSPKGSRLLYQLEHRLLSVDRATGHVSVVVDFSDACSVAYRWSPDETRLAYLINRNGDCMGPSELHVVTATGEDDRLIHPAATFCGGAYGDQASVWSADGSHVAYVVTSIPVSADLQPLSGTVTFHAAPIADSTPDSTGGVRPSASVELPSADYAPSAGFVGTLGPLARLNAETTCEWSPRANWLAVSGIDLHVLRADGSDRHVFESSHSSAAAALVGAVVWWSPDGERLGRYVHDGQSFRLRTLNVSASGAARAELDVELRNPCCSDLTWSPDGRHAMYVVDDDGSADDQIPPPPRVHLWHAERGADEQVGDQSAHGFNADGTRFYYGIDSLPETAPQIRLVDGGPTVAVPGAVGWATENAALVLRDGKVIVRSVDSGEESTIWQNTADERLLSLVVPRWF